MKSQESQILKALKKGRRITPLDALMEWGCMRLSARIYDLREQGYMVMTEIVATAKNKHVARYYLER